MSSRKWRILRSTAPIVFLPFADGATIITSGRFEDIAAAITSPQPIRLEFDGKVEFPTPITITTRVEFDATGRSIEFDGRSATQLFRITSSGDLTLRSLTLQNASKTGDRAETIFASAVESQGGAITIDRCVLTNNVSHGGRAIVEPIDPRDPNSLLRLVNGGNALGGAVSGSGGRITISDSKFVQNAALGSDHAAWMLYFGEYIYARGGAGYGGAIWASNNVVSIQRTEFIENRVFGPGWVYGGVSATTAWGGAVYALGGNVSIIDSTFKSNWANGGNGGAAMVGIRNVAGEVISPLAVSGCRFEENRASSTMSAYGGALHIAKPFNIEGCVFLRNQAEGLYGSWGNGGALVAGSGRLINSVFAENRSEGSNDTVSPTWWLGTATWGQGSAVWGSGFVIEHSTFFANTSTKPNFPAYQGSTIGGTIDGSGISVRASVIAPGEGPSAKGTVTDGGFNVSGDSSLAVAHPTSVNNVDARLEFRSGSFGLYWPRPDSPAIDRVTERIAQFDIRGAMRPETGSDAGAVELEGTTRLSAGVLAETTSFLLLAPVLDPVAVFASSDFLTWDAIGTMSPALTGGMSFEIPLGSNYRFFQGRLD